jgi:capsular exopolysaccharide synthesis family protein
VEFIRYFRVLLRWWWVLLLCAAIAGGVVAATTLNRKPFYTANALLSVIPLGTTGGIDYGSYLYFERLAATYSTIARSPRFDARGQEMLGLEILPNFSIEVLPQTELMKFSVDAGTPEDAQRYCNALVQLLLEENLRRYTDVGIIEQLRKRRDTLTAEVAALTQQRTEANNEVPRDEEKIAILDRELGSKSGELAAATGSYNQATNTIATVSNALSIYQLAELPTQPSNRNPLINISIAVAAGLLAGVALTFVLENMNTKLFTERQIANVTQSTILGKVPRMNRKHVHNVFKYDPISAEGFRRMRVALSPSTTDISRKTLLVTSALPEEGKSIIAVNLAYAFAQVADQCVIIVDCDLRRPTLHRLYDLPNTAGLTNILMDQCKIDEAIQETEFSRLSVLTAGAEVTTPTEFLSSQRMTELLQILSQRYTTIILDLPPVLATSDALTLAPQSSGVLFVLDPKQVNEATVKVAIAQLHAPDITLSGVVLNRVPLDANTRYLRYYTNRRKGGK